MSHAVFINVLCASDQLAILLCARLIHDRKKSCLTEIANKTAAHRNRTPRRPHRTDTQHSLCAFVSLKGRISRPGASTSTLCHVDALSQNRPPLFLPVKKTQFYWRGGSKQSTKLAPWQILQINCGNCWCVLCRERERPVWKQLVISMSPDRVHSLKWFICQNSWADKQFGTAVWHVIKTLLTLLRLLNFAVVLMWV